MEIKDQNGLFNFKKELNVKKFVHNKKYLENEEIKALNLSDKEFENYYAYIVQMVENKQYILKRDDGGKLHVYHINSEQTHNWIYKSFSDKLNNLRLTKEFFGGKIQKAKLDLINLLNKSKNEPSSLYLYSDDPLEIELLIAYANELANSNQTIAFIDLETLYKKLIKKESIHNIFESCENVDVVFLINIRDFNTYDIYSEYVIPLLKARRLLRAPTIFFSSYKIVELRRKIENKFKYKTDTMELANLIEKIVGDKEYSV